MSWQPNCGVAMAKTRAEMTRAARHFFHERDVLEVTTPILSRVTTTDPNVESLTTKTVHGHAFLQTSPEYCMKRLLSAGYPDIYQICPVFRAAESGRHHLPEFTMIEWYRRGFGLHDMMRETVAMIAALLPDRALQNTGFCSYRDVFLDNLDIDPLVCDVEVLASAMGADDRLRAALGSDKDVWLDLVMTDRIAPAFDSHNLTVVFHYPESQAALARTCPDDELVADRFEVYLGPLELANGFVELTDPVEQRRRFMKDRKRRAQAGQAMHDIDEALLAALESGLPSCAGVAVGLERLLMLQVDAADVHDVVTFSPGRPSDD